MRARTIGLALALAIGAAGCLATAGSRMTVTARTPTLVLIDGDLWVVENYHEPVFYTDGFYWRFSGGAWYRSHVYNEGWVTITTVPASIRRIDRPTRYARYAAPPAARRQVGPPAHAPAHGVRGTAPGHARSPVAESKPDHSPDKGKAVKSKAGGKDKGPDKGGKKK